jgi:hypothetical protein
MGKFQFFLKVLICEISNNYIEHLIGTFLLLHVFCACIYINHVSYSAKVIESTRYSDIEVTRNDYG